MFKLTTLAGKATSSQLPKISTGITMTALLLLTLTSTAQAADIKNNNAPLAGTFVNPATYFGCDTEAQISHLKHYNSTRYRIDCMLIQLRNYQQNNKHSSRQRYFAYKAQAWLNYANNEDSNNSRTPAGRQALLAGSAIFQALQNEDDENLNVTTDIPSTSALMRPDLWATLSALKNSDGINDAPKELAFSEVTLIWAAANQCENGYQQSGIHFRRADRWLEQAREAYINAHNSQTNVALEERINRYYKQYALLDPSPDVCRGQVLPSSTQALDIHE